MAFIAIDQLIGSAGLNAVYTAGNLGYPWVSSTVNPLPAVAIEQMFGQIIAAQNNSSISTQNGSAIAGGAEFIFLKIPTSTTVTPGLFYTWDGAYNVTVASTTNTSGRPLALAINTVSSNASSAQGTWFQVQGLGVALKSSFISNVQPNVALYISGTAGRVRTTASTLKSIIGIRSGNTVTVASTTSTLLVYLNRPNSGPSL
jgi:hypothetical protein